MLYSHVGTRGALGLGSAILACLLFAGVASADPLPSGLVGAPPNTIQVTTSGTHAFPLTNGGGGFHTTVWTGPGQTGPTYTTTMWCVDSQMYFSSGNTGLANITRLSSLPTAEARYGTINQPASVGDPGWTNGFGGVLDLAQTRFQMAAWLLEQYGSFPAGPTPGNSSVNLAIQRAIWAITHNTTPGADTTGVSSLGVDDTSSTDAAYWIKLAKSSYSSASLSNWAVVSWVVDSSGNLLSDDKQTFLVQVTPEPGFYVLLGAGLALLLIARRRKSALLEASRS